MDHNAPGSPESLLIAAGVPSNLISVEGGGHGDFGKASAEIDRLVREFFARHLRGDEQLEIKDRTLQAQ